MIRQFSLALLAVAVFCAPSQTGIHAAPTVRGTAEAAFDLLLLDWRGVDIDRVIEIFHDVEGQKEIFAPLSEGYACSPLRVVRVLTEVEAGSCTGCVTVEFGSAAADKYVVTAVVVEYSATNVSSTKAMLRRLLRGAGIPESVIDVPQASGRRATWSGRWSVPDEMRSLDVSVERLSGTVWRLHFDHGRHYVPGVPAVPPS